MSEEVKCKLPIEQLEKYHIYTGFYESDVMGCYQNYLNYTDYKITKLYEKIMEDPEHFKELADECYAKESELFYWRQVAREELSKLQEEYYEEHKTPEERAYESQFGSEAEAEKAEEQKKHPIE